LYGVPSEIGAGVIDILYAGSFEGTVPVEHEDPGWRGSRKEVEAGLAFAYRAVRPLIIQEPPARQRAINDRGALQP
jgi:hypothetical protein